MNEAFLSLTAAEQVDLFVATPSNIPAQSFEVYGVALALVAQAFTSKKPHLIRDADNLFLQLQQTKITALDIREGGSGCILWFGELMDIKYYTDGEDMFLKMSSEFDYGTGSKRSRFTKAIVIVLTILATALLFLLLHLLRMRIQKKRGRIKFNSEMVALNKIEGEDFEVPLFDFTEIANATNNFSDHNKLGEGGFGPVYKGLLTDGQEIAVKRLAKDSRQGVDEFMNEVSCIAKL